MEAKSGSLLLKAMFIWPTEKGIFRLLFVQKGSKMRQANPTATIGKIIRKAGAMQKQIKWFLTLICNTVNPMKGILGFC